MSRAEFYAFADRAMAAPAQEPTDEPDPHRTDHLEPGTPEWARIGTAGHRCQRCGNSCGTTRCHEACCSTERCTGHPCPACDGRGPRPDADAIGLFSIAAAKPRGGNR